MQRLNLIGLSGNPHLLLPFKCLTSHLRLSAPVACHQKQVGLALRLSHRSVKVLEGVSLSRQFTLLSLRSGDDHSTGMGVVADKTRKQFSFQRSTQSLSTQCHKNFLTRPLKNHATSRRKFFVANQKLKTHLFLD